MFQISWLLFRVSIWVSILFVRLPTCHSDVSLGRRGGLSPLMIEKLSWWRPVAWADLLSRIKSRVKSARVTVLLTLVMGCIVIGAAIGGGLRYFLDRYHASRWEVRRLELQLALAASIALFAMHPLLFPSMTNKRRRDGKGCFWIWETP